MAPKFLRTVFAALVLVASTTAEISESGKTVIVNGIAYYAAPEAVSIIDATPDMLKHASTTGVDLIPLTVFADSSRSFTTEVFRSLVANYTATDDVFNTGFLQAIYLKHVGSSPATVKYPLGAALTQYGTKLFMPARAYTSSVKSQGQTFTGWRTEIPAGPYFMSPRTGNVYQAYRLYSDEQGAFTEGLKPNADGSYSVLSAAVPGDHSPTIGVPSRLYYTKTADKPLAGVRLGVKDIYDIKGVKTGNGNRAYYDLYPPRAATCPAVQRLIDAGAVIIGKMKTSQFANGESPTADWVDYHCPFNARGDGYQDPSSSSSGPGAGIGAYSWLDIGLGSDTGGSIRGPSGSNGCYGNRPSHGLVTLDGVMPLSPALDTAGFLTRDPILWHAASKALYGTNITSDFPSLPKKILTSGFPTTARTEAQTILLDFLSKLQDFLKAPAPTAIVPATLWAASPPAEAGNASLSNLLNLAYPTVISQQQYNLLTLPFYADYAAAHNGKRPFVNPTPLIRWAFGQVNMTADATESALRNATIFRTWWEKEVIVPSKESCSESILVYTQSSGNPSYRNIYGGQPGIPTGISVGRLSGFAEEPDMVFPIGQASYNSTITLQEEVLPVAVSIVAAKGCDGMIFTLAEKLLAAGILKIPKTGSVTF
ncbi:putative Glutamyl-tRNA(Gln) amidotransferase subunit A [Venustampulla echinocandica]|uniref:Putative Glutamyl-tRNA(Gln) amidotransferase subunit A n=1 Tax=Venustampulla echinocandica TaxID=2656787 RepID=A0A370TKH2_9HELO|nr:putative Glutamyl-tRNA(Gln) amidotransferase subunit A [Venustampulla echinocandica]RDL36007.1 putative Glutamyl-tRNA(Gln) amidotransferase subunit A [Venustampulla echinocandica]